MKPRIALPILLVLLWFLAKTLWLVPQVPPGFAPDEMFHIQVTELYATSETPFVFSDSYSTYPAPSPAYSRYGFFSEMPYLYHLTLGKLSALLGIDVYEFSSIVFLRLLNLAFVFGGLLCCLGFYRRLKLNSSEQCAALILQTSLLMFTALSAAISYDNAQFFLASAAWLLWASLRERFLWSRMFLFLSILGIGSLTKIAMLPLALLQLFSLPLLREKTLNETGHVTERRAKMYLFAGLFLLVSLLNLELYGGNLLRYGDIKPSCSAVYGTEVCAHDFDAEQHEAKRKNEGAPRISLAAFIVTWAHITVSRASGIYSHRGVRLPEPLVCCIEAVYLLGIVAFLLGARRSNRSALTALLIALIYCGVVIVVFSYPYYVLTGEPGYGVNGRYVFPILPALIVPLIFAVRGVAQTKLRQCIVMGVCGCLLALEASVLFIAPTFKNMYLKRPGEVFYRSLPYRPGPVYNESFELIERNDKKDTVSVCQ